MPMQPEDFVPMAANLKVRVLEAARKQREEQAAFEAEAAALVLCPPDCAERHPRRPEWHCHTFLDMWRAAPAIEYGRECQQAQEAAHDATNLDVRPHLARAGVKEAHRKALSGLDEQRVAVRAAKAWLGQARDANGAMTHPWLVLTGGTGTGKTQGAAFVLEHFIRRYPWNQKAGGDRSADLRPFVQIHATDFVQLARQAKAYSLMGSANTLVDEACRARVLVLDDVGTERLGAEEVELFQRVANERHASRRVTVWTSNVTAKELETRLDFAGTEANQRGRLWRRVADSAAVVELVKTGSRMVMGGRTTDFPTFRQKEAKR